MASAIIQHLPHRHLRRKNSTMRHLRYPSRSLPTINRCFSTGANRHAEEVPAQRPARAHLTGNAIISGCHGFCCQSRLKVAIIVGVFVRCSSADQREAGGRRIVPWRPPRPKPCRGQRDDERLNTPTTA
jgi:hypothetical protein